MEDVQISKLADRLLREIDLRLDSTLCGGQMADPRDMKALLGLIEQFQPNPQLLDSQLRSFVGRLVNRYRQVLEDELTCGEHIGVIFYHLAKIRGIKVVSNCLTSDLYLLTAVLDRVEKLDDSDSAQWQETFFLLAWLSILVLVPFPLEKIRPGLAKAIFDLSRKYLQSSGKVSDASALLLARLLSRADCAPLLQSFVAENFNSLAWEQKSVFEQLGLLTTTNHLFRLCAPQTLDSFGQRLLVLIANQLDTPNASSLRFFVKNLGKLGVHFVRTGNYDAVEEIFNYLFDFVGDASTVIRYSVAKQLAKITSLLPQQLRNDVVGALVAQLELPADGRVDAESIDVELFHGVLLAIGEQARTRQLDTAFLPELATLLHQTLFLEQYRVTHAVGSNVRDATCFIIWSLAKGYKTDQMGLELWRAFFRDLVLCCCFDKELIVRRASAACVQEIVGRHGEIFDRNDKHSLKVKLIETLDYTVLGQLDRAFALSLDICKLGLLQKEIQTALEHAVLHRDYEIRTRAARTLRKLGDKQLIQRYFQEKFQPGRFYVLAELLQDATEVETDKYHRLFEDFTFDFHRDPFHKGEEYLYLLTVLCREGFIANDHELETVFNVIRNSSEQVSQRFCELAAVLVLPEKYITKWLLYIKTGSLVAARAVGHANWLETRVNDVLGLVTGHADAELRSCLILSLAEYLHRHDVADHQKQTLIACLDDYTVTNRGDVGSLVRSATMDLIEANRDKLGNHALINSKLLRIAGETMERLRVAALKLVADLNEWQFVPPESDVDHFQALMRIYCAHVVQDRELSREFWKGYCFSAGSQQSLAQATNAALLAFFQAWEQLEDRKTVLSDILSILKPLDTAQSRIERATKTQDACLRFLCNALELNLPLPAEIAARSIFVRVYNLTLGKTHPGRLAVAIRVFVQLALADPADTKGDCVARLTWLSKKHPTASVRLAALEALQEIECDSL
ncbi:hypothetical protein KL936_005266 [Ogataea polymorpha]|nr:hypothetical protein KL936_005266 [Ogataea polymorpha]